VIVNTSVVAAKGAENLSIYAATKAAVRSFARTAASELKSRNILHHWRRAQCRRRHGEPIAGPPKT
jgi:NADP-dependent 3-hydroxy acid dehydrogenase YdfG